jgi:hypothetical protein
MTLKAELHAYQPPERELASTILAFRDLQMAATWSVRVSSDPLGPVNRIVSLMNGNQRVKSVLYPVGVGDTVRLIRDKGGYRMDDLFAMKPASHGPLGDIDPDPLPSWREPGWRVEVNGRTVLAVTDAELAPPRPPVPRIPLWRRMRQAWVEQARADADAVAGRLGYHRAGECTGWDE